MAKIHIGRRTAYFHCPGCEHAHGVNFDKAQTDKPAWEFNGDVDAPTITPSILYRSAIVCHSYVTDGQIRFLGDCEHALAGQTVELPDFHF